VLSMVLGLWAMISFSATCMAAGLLQIAIGFLVVALEAPFCCMWFDFIERIGQFSENRPLWQKAALYCIGGLIPLIMCFELATFLGSGLIMVTGFCYGFLAVGKKADRQTMMAAAGSTQNITSPQAQTDAWDSRVDQKPYP